MRRDNKALSPPLALIYWTCGRIYAKQGEADLTGEAALFPKARFRQLMAATLPPPRLLPSGDSAVTVEFSRTIDDAANERVLALDKALAASPIEGITETVPTYRSLLVHYDPVRIGFDALGDKLLVLASQPLPPATKARRWRIPVAYGGEHGIDLEAELVVITDDVPMAVTPFAASHSASCIAASQPRAGKSARPWPKGTACSRATAASPSMTTRCS